MGYFDGLTNSSFKKDVSGRTVFYPWGVLGKGRVLPDEETENRIRGFVRRYYMVSLPGIIIVGAVVGWVYAFALVPILMVWYHFKSKALILRCPVAHDKLTLKESYANSAKAHNKITLWLLFIFSMFLGAGGLLMLIRGDYIIGAFSCLFFGACVVVMGYMIKAKRT